MPRGMTGGRLADSPLGDKSHDLGRSALRAEGVAEGVTEDQGPVGGDPCAEIDLLGVEDHEEVSSRWRASVL
ncbi:MAG: hypothetical protein HY898_17790 [Deltaproteobacteria bacterium]|nr:hypothetical protein [Deltaproteobacteria bacterium]